MIKCSEDVFNLQRDLDIAMEWSLYSLLSLSIDKCKAMCVSLHTTSANVYFIVDLKSGKRVMVPYTEKDLGVWISSD